MLDQSDGQRAGRWRKWQFGRKINNKLLPKTSNVDRMNHLERTKLCYFRSAEMLDRQCASTNAHEHRSNSCKTRWIRNGESTWSDVEIDDDREMKRNSSWKIKGPKTLNKVKCVCVCWPNENSGAKRIGGWSTLSVQIEMCWANWFWKLEKSNMKRRREDKHVCMYTLPGMWRPDKVNKRHDGQSGRSGIRWRWEQDHEEKGSSVNERMSEDTSKQKKRGKGQLLNKSWTAIDGWCWICDHFCFVWKTRAVRKYNVGIVYTTISRSENGKGQQDRTRRLEHEPNELRSSKRAVVVLLRRVVDESVRNTLKRWCDSFEFNRRGWRGKKKVNGEQICITNRAWPATRVKGNVNGIMVTPVSLIRHPFFPLFFFFFCIFWFTRFFFVLHIVCMKNQLEKHEWYKHENRKVMSCWDRMIWPDGERRRRRRRWWLWRWREWKGVERANQNERARHNTRKRKKQTNERKCKFNRPSAKWNKHRRSAATDSKRIRVFHPKSKSSETTMTNRSTKLCGSVCRVEKSTKVMTERPEVDRLNTKKKMNEIKRRRAWYRTWNEATRAQSEQPERCSVR